MFCEKCGSRLAEGARFCTVCGAQAKGAVSTQMETFENAAGGTRVAVQKGGVKEKVMNLIDLWKNEKDPKKKWGIPAAVIAVIVVLAFFLLKGADAGGAKSEDACIKQSVDAIYKGDAEKLLDLMPKEYTDMVQKEWGYTRKEMIEELEDSLEYYDHTEDLGKGWSYEYHCESHKCDREELSDFREELRDEGVKNFNVSAVTVVEVEVDIYDADGYYYDTDYMELYLMKSGDRWYMIWD